MIDHGYTALQPTKKKHNPLIAVGIVCITILFLCLILILSYFIIVSSSDSDNQKIRRFYGRDFFLGHEFMVDIDARDIWISNHFDGDTHLCTDSKKCRNGIPTSSCSSMTQTVLDALTIHPNAQKGATVSIIKSINLNIYRVICTQYTYGSTEWCLTDDDRLAVVTIDFNGEEMTFHITGHREVTSDEIADQC
ncbi:hypothetical protein P9112_003593 [Eukaryota sp. TZLM1-RC]